MKPSNALSHTSSVTRVRPLFLAWALVLLLLVPKTAQAQEPVACEDAVATANNHFLFGRFDEAIELLEDCLSQDAFSDEEKPEVYKLLVQIFDAKGLEEKVKETLAKLLALVPNYEPDPDDTQAFKQMVEAYKREIAAAAEPEEPPIEAPPPGPVVEVTLATEHGEAVRNVRLRQDGDWLVVTYDLVGTAKKYEVRLLLSTDGGRTYEALPQTVTGEVGEGMLPGAGKEMRWAALQDYPQGLPGDQYRVQVTAQKQGGRGLLYVLGGALVAGGGATVALLLGGGGNGGGNGNGGPGDIPVPPGRPPGN